METDIFEKERAMTKVQPRLPALDAVFYTELCFHSSFCKILWPKQSLHGSVLFLLKCILRAAHAEKLERRWLGPNSDPHF